MRLPEEPDTPLAINIVPMIDIIFSILAFFIISTLFLTKSEGLPVNLPGATTAQQQPSTELTVTIETEGDVFLNEEPIAIESLVSVVGELVNPQAPSLVIVNADEGVNHGVVVQVMDQLRQVEGARLAIAAKKQPEKED
jgi:biopolymer transport protein ExbD